MFLPFGLDNYSGWDQAEVNRLEQKTFEADDEIVASKEQSNEEWIEEIKSQIYDTVRSERNPLTIADFD